MTRSPERPFFVLLLFGLVLAAILWAADRWEARMSEQAGEMLAPGNTPIFVPSGGNYSSSLLVEIHPSHSRAHVVFTTDGTVPTATVGALYDHPLLLDRAFPGLVVLRARQFLDGVPGPVSSTSYAVGLSNTLPILSLIADPPDLWDLTSGILARPGERGAAWERPVHLTLLTGEPAPGFQVDAGLRTHHIGHSQELKPSFRLYFRREYGAPRLEYPLFPLHPEQNTQAYKRLLLLAGGRSARWTLLEDQLLCDVATAMGMPAPQGRFVLLFVNGQPWGIYRLTERVDRFFAEDMLGLTGADVIRDGDADEGVQAHWDDLMAWLRTHDLRDPTQYAALEGHVDLDEFTDYVVLLAYFGRTDFIAVRPGDGSEPWRWLPQEGRAWAVLRAQVSPGPLASPEAAGDLSVLLDRLLENPEYRRGFASRLADMLNTALSPAAVETQIDRLAATVEPDIGYEAARWDSPTDWESNVAALRYFARQRPAVLRRQVAQRLGLQDATPVTFTLSPGGGGTVFVNGAAALPAPWSGAYFQGTTVRVTAVPAPGYAFAGWQTASGKPLPPSAQVTLAVEGPETVTARFVPAAGCPRAVCPDDVVINEFWINDNGTHYLTLGNRPLEGDWVELRVVRGPVDLRRWRLTDNDTKDGMNEGSIIFRETPALAAVPKGTVILIIATESPSNARYFGQDDLDPSDRRIVLFVGNGNLDATTDPGFAIGTGDDNLVLLAPGPTPSFADDVGVDFVAEGQAVTPFSFGVLKDGVQFTASFLGLGTDDGALFTGDVNNDSAADWIVDPPAEQSGDSIRLDVANIVTPGAANYRQGEALLRTITLWALLVAPLGAGVLLLGARQRRAHHRRRTSGM